MCTVFQVCFVFCLVRRSRKYPETNPLTNIRENKRKHTAFVTWILKKLLPLLQWNVYVSQWLSTITWPGQTGLTNEFTSLPWPRYRGRSVRNVKISLEWRGYWVLVLRLEICYYIQKTLIHGTCVGVLQTPKI